MPSSFPPRTPSPRFRPTPFPRTPVQRPQSVQSPRTDDISTGSSLGSVLSRGAPRPPQTEWARPFALPETFGPAGSGEGLASPIELTSELPRRDSGLIDPFLIPMGRASTPSSASSSPRVNIPRDAARSARVRGLALADSPRNRASGSRPPLLPASLRDNELRSYLTVDELPEFPTPAEYRRCYAAPDGLPYEQIEDLAERDRAFDRTNPLVPDHAAVVPFDSPSSRSTLC